MSAHGWYDAEDARQDAHLIALSRGQRWENDAHRRRWLELVAMREMARSRRRDTAMFRPDVTVDADDVMPLIDPWPRVDGDLDGLALLSDLRERVSRLDAPVLVCGALGIPRREVAEVLGRTCRQVDRSGVRIRLAAAA